MKKIILLLILILNFWSAALNCFAQNQKKEIDSLIQITLFGANDSNKVTALNELAWKLSYTNPDTSVLLTSQALQLSEKIHYPRGIANSHYSKSTFLSRMGKNDEAMEGYLISADVSKKINFLVKESSCYGGIGIIYWDKGEYAMALKYFFDALRIDEKLNYKIGIARHLGNIGSLYKDQGEFQKALDHYLKALKIDKETGRKRGEAIRLGNIGNVYYDLKNFEKAKQYFYEALTLSQEINLLSEVANNYIRLANVYKLINAVPEAFENYQLALKIQQEINDLKGKAITFGNIGALHLQEKNYKDAEQNLLNALELSKGLNLFHHLRICHETLSILYSQKENYQLSLLHYKKYSELKDSLFNESKSKEIGKLEATYEIEKKQAEEEQKLKEESRKLKEETERRDNIQYSIIFIAILAVFGTILSLGFIKISPKFAEGLIFFAFLIFFEFCLVLLDPYVDKYSGGEPAYKLLFNAMLAGAIFPIHSFFEKTLQRKIVK